MVACADRVVATGPVFAQAVYPAKNITLVVPLALEF
jgi:hypothetical protein